MPPTAVRIISRCTITPRPLPQHPRQQLLQLTPSDLGRLSLHYIQNGLLFYNPHFAADRQEKEQCIAFVNERLKHSLSFALEHFFPLAGRLVTQKAGASSSYIFINCNDAGAEFIHAVADDICVADILASTYLHPIIKACFPLDEIIGHDGHSHPLVAAQLTQLRDGFFLALSLNHVAGDGASFWNFFNSWGEIARTGESTISRPPVIQPWFPPTVIPPISLPLSNPEEMVERYTRPPLRVRYFHLSSESIARLKAKANNECKTEKISSFQALSALVWRSITRSRRFPAGQTVTYGFAVNYRPRVEPPQSQDYLGNLIQAVTVNATASELIANGLGRAAWLVHQTVKCQTDGAIRAAFESWANAPVMRSLSHMADGRTVAIANSPRFEVYGVDFGWGKAAAVRGGLGNRFDGRLSAYAGREGGGSVDLEICLRPETMSALESDEEFLDYVI